MLNGISNSNQKPQGPILARLLLTKKKTWWFIYACQYCGVDPLHTAEKPDVSRFYTAMKTKTNKKNKKKSNN